jgi:hypothetical protein
MSDDRAFERAREAWLEAGSDRPSDHAIDAVLLAVRTTPQERGVRLPWILPASFRLAAAAVIAVAVVGALFLNLPGRNEIGGPTPSPTPAWQTFTSQRFGYSVSFPGDFVQINQSGGLPEDLFPGDQSDWADRFDEPRSHVPFLVVARATPQHPMTMADVVESYDTQLSSTCTTSEPEAITVGGSAARFITARCLPYSWFDVTVEHDGHLYVLQWNSSSQALDADRATFERVLESFVFTN